MADTFARWIAQKSDELLPETYALPVALELACATQKDQLSFDTLPHTITMVQSIIRTSQHRVKAYAKSQSHVLVEGSSLRRAF